MNIQVKAPQLVTSKEEMDRQEAMDYAKEKIEKALGVFDIEPTVATIVLKTEGSESDPVQKIEVSASLRSEPLNQKAHSRDIGRAIDRAAKDLERQVRKYKTRLIDKGRKDSADIKRQIQDSYSVNTDCEEEK